MAIFLLEKTKVEVSVPYVDVQWRAANKGESKFIINDVSLSQRAERNVELVDESRRLIFRLNVAVKLFGQAIDQARPKAAPRGLTHDRTAALNPRQLQLFVVRHRSDFGSSRDIRPRAILDRVRA
jgi:hypothetical protein